MSDTTKNTKQQQTMQAANPTIADPSAVERNINHPKKSVLTKLRESFGGKVSKSTYNSLLQKYDRLKEERDALKSDCSSLELIVKEVERIIDASGDKFLEDSK